MHCKTCGDCACEKINDVHHLVAYSTEEDVDGNFHYHDRNDRWQKWMCSRGHVFRCAAYNHCWCGWTSQYPTTINVEFKPRPKEKRLKFSQKIVITNNKHIDFLIKSVIRTHESDENSETF